MIFSFGQFTNDARLFKDKHGDKVLIISIFSFVLGITLQIQTDIAGLRINMADLLIPFTGLFIGISLLRNRSYWPQWNIPHAYILLIALALWMAVSFVNGYFYIGTISHWALYNKLCGFMVLLAYFALGGWLYSNYREMSLKPFITGFLLFFAFVLAMGAVLIFAYEAFPAQLPPLFPFEALMGNRNAYALLLIAGMVFLWTVDLRRTHLLPVWLIRIQMAALPLVFAYNGSRAGWIVFLCVTFYFLIVHFKWFSKTVLIWLVLGGVLAGLFFAAFDTHLEKRQHVTRVKNSFLLWHSEGDMILDDVEKDNRKTRQYASELIRLRNMRDSLKLWNESPLIGAGLGSLLHYQYQTYNPQTTFIDIMDSSPVWLLAETGLIGLGLFLVFYIFVLRALWIKRQQAEGLEAAFAEALFIFLLAFGAMSVLHEIIYTRFLWLMMGIGVAVAVAIRRPNSIQNQ